MDGLQAFPAGSTQVGQFRLRGIAPYARRFARARLMNRSYSSITAHRLALDIHERQFTDAVEFPQNIWTTFERMEPSLAIAKL